MREEEKNVGPIGFLFVAPVSLLHQTRESVHFSPYSLYSISLFSISCLPNRPLERKKRFCHSERKISTHKDALDI